MKSSIRVMLADKITGEVVSVDKVTKSSVKALKRWASHLVTYCPEAEFEVLEGSENSRKYFEDFFKTLTMPNKGRGTEMIVVGVKTKILENFCYEVDNIRPLHLAQSLAYNISNVRSFKRDNEHGLVHKSLEARRDMYKEAWEMYGLTMSQLNQFAWLEYEWELREADHGKFYNCKCVECGSTFRNQWKDTNTCDKCWDLDLFDWDEE
jgi:hypothetical protein